MVVNFGLCFIEIFLFLNIWLSLYILLNLLIISFFKWSFVVIFKYRLMFKVLWWVIKGFAAVLFVIGFKIGVFIFKNFLLFKNFWIEWIIKFFLIKVLWIWGFIIRLRYFFLYFVLIFLSLCYFLGSGCKYLVSILIFFVFIEILFLWVLKILFFIFIIFLIL